MEILDQLAFGKHRLGADAGASRGEVVRLDFRDQFLEGASERALQKLVPEIQPDDLAPGGAGVRAQAMLPEGKLVEDFHFEEAPGILHVVNAPSPGATASLAIGETIAEKVL